MMLPIVSLDEILIAPCINAVEECNVVVVGIPGLFLTADMDKISHMVLHCRLPELTAKVNPSIYTKNARVENGQELLYVQLQKALYGTLQAALIFIKN